MNEGHDKLWGWFGLSRASFLVLPRVLMHEMPDQWQSKMADLLYEYEATMDDGQDSNVFVSARKDSKYVAIPDWLKNYRHPDPGRVAAARRTQP